MTILLIETSTNVCSVALSHGGQLIFEKRNAEGMNHAELLSPFISEAIEAMTNNNLTLNAVAVSGGPGSYTGLRIGVSTAKGLCYGYDIPLITINTLELIAIHGLKKTNHPDALFCPMIDARRMEVYAGLYDRNLVEIEAVSAKIISSNSYSQYLEDKYIYFFGNGASKCKEDITHPHAVFVDDILPLAENMVALAEKKYASKEFADVAYYEPFYLKEFFTTAIPIH